MEGKPNKKYKILALSGGGAKGAFEAGAVNALAECLKEEASYDLITGVSAGALNMIIMAMHNNIHEAAHHLKTLWLSTIKSNDSIFKAETRGIKARIIMWVLFKLKGIKEEALKIVLSHIYLLYNKKHEGGLVDTTPLRELITNEIKGKKFCKPYRFQATNMNKGCYDYFSQESFNGDQDDNSRLVSYLMATSAFPMMFPSQVINGTRYSDGGWISNINILEALEWVVNHEKIPQCDVVVDIIFTSPVKDDITTKYDEISPIDVFERFVGVVMHYLDNKDIEEIKYKFPQVSIRYIIAPQKELGNITSAMDFNHVKLESYYNRGYHRAIEVLQGSSKIAQQLMTTAEYKNEDYYYKNEDIIEKQLLQEMENEVINYGAKQDSLFNLFE